MFEIFIKIWGKSKMNSATHAAIGAAIASIFYPEVDCMAVAAIASQVPDIDSTESAIGAMVWPIARWLESTSLHRGLTHSILFCGGLSVAAVASAIYYFGDRSWGVAFAIGIFSSILGDCFTKQGCQLFWPLRLWCVVGLNPRRRLKSGSPIEYWIILISGLVILISIQIQGLKGITLSLPSSADDVLVKYPSYCVLSKIKAKNNINQEILTGNYLAIGASSFWRPGQLITSDQYTIISRSFKPVKECGVNTVVVNFQDESFQKLFPYIKQYAFVFGRVESDDALINNGNFQGEPIGRAIDIIGTAWITGDLYLKIYRELIEL